MSGIEVLEKLKQVNAGIEVVMMTAFETTDTIRQALRDFGILLQEMPLGCNAPVARIRVDRSRQALLFKRFYC